MSTKLSKCRECEGFRFAPVNALKKPDMMYCMDCLSIYRKSPARWRKEGKFIKVNEE